MQIVVRQLRPNELDHELIWLVVSVAALGLAIFWFAIGLPWPRCVFHELTGLPCLTCGATRSVIEFLHGRFVGALKWNPAVFAVLCGLSIFNLYALIVLIGRAPRLRVATFSAGDKTFARALVPSLLAANWIYLLSHWRAF